MYLSFAHIAVHNAQQTLRCPHTSCVKLPPDITTSPVPKVCTDGLWWRHMQHAMQISPGVITSYCNMPFEVVTRWSATSHETCKNALCAYNDLAAMGLQVFNSRATQQHVGCTGLSTAEQQHKADPCMRRCRASQVRSRATHQHNYIKHHDTRHKLLGSAVVAWPPMQSVCASCMQ